MIGGRPGAAFTVSPWERSAEALRCWATEDWPRAIEILEVQLADDPDNANVLYNLACAESRSGKPDEALAHLSARSSWSRALRSSPETTPTSTRSGPTTAFLSRGLTSL